MPFKLAVF